MRELTIEEKQKFGYKEKILKHLMEKETCDTCGGDQFYVVYMDYKPTKELKINLAHDVEFFCVKCNTESSGVTMNEGL